MKCLLPIVLFVNFLLLSSCKKYRPAPDAFFIKSSKVSVATTSPTLQGSGSHKITELFLYVNKKFIGAYPSGNLLPIVSHGKTVSIDVFAGIKNSGIQDKTTSWLLYDRISFDTLVESGKTIERPFTFRYNPNVTFHWIESFDGQVGFSLIKAGGDTTFKIAAPQDSYEGKSAEIGLTGSSSYKWVQLESAKDYALPSGNSNIYLELDYRCDCKFKMGLTDGVNMKEVYVFNPSGNWNKIYIQLSPSVGQQPTADKYRIYFKVEKPNGVESAHVWLDNIKLIHL